MNKLADKASSLGSQVVIKAVKNISQRQVIGRQAALSTDPDAVSGGAAGVVFLAEEQPGQRPEMGWVWLVSRRTRGQ